MSRWARGTGSQARVAVRTVMHTTRSKRKGSNHEVIMKSQQIITFCLSFVIFSSLTLAGAHGQNKLLRELAKEDQDQRHGKEVPRTDEERVKLVLAEIGRGEVKVPEDKFNAALVLQHTPLTFRGKQLVSESSDNYLLAHYLFESAFEGGYKHPLLPYLVAASTDR